MINHGRDARIDWFDKHFCLSLESIREGRAYTLLTSTLWHFEPLHLIANMVGIWEFGRAMIMLYDVPTAILIWIGSGVAGGLLQTYMWSRNAKKYDWCVCRYYGLELGGWSYIAVDHDYGLRGLTASYKGPDMVNCFVKYLGYS